MSIVDEARHSFFIYRHLRGHATKLEQVDFLSVAFQDSMCWVGQTDEGQVVSSANSSEKAFASSGPTTTISVSCAVNLS